MNFWIQMNAGTLASVSKMMHCTWTLVMKVVWVRTA